MTAPQRTPDFRFGAWQRPDGSLYRAMLSDTIEGPNFTAARPHQEGCEACRDRYLTADEANAVYEHQTEEERHEMALCACFSTQDIHPDCPVHGLTAQIRKHGPFGVDQVEAIMKTLWLGQARAYFAEPQHDEETWEFFARVHRLSDEWVQDVLASAEEEERNPSLP